MLVADANRLAALSATVGSLDLSFLLAAEGFRLADTPETEDGLLAGLVEHRRAVRVVPFTGAMFGAEPRKRRADPRHRCRVTDPELGHRPPGSRPACSWTWRRSGPGTEWHGANTSPTDDRTVYSGGRRGRSRGSGWPTADGHVTVLPSGAQVGGAPIGTAFTADGRLLDVFVATSDEGGVSTWRLVADRPRRRSAARQRHHRPHPAEGGELSVNIAEDASSAIIWSGRRHQPSHLRRPGDGEPGACGAPSRGTSTSNEYRAFPSGAAMLWDDGTVTLFDRAGAVVQELDAHRLPVRDVALAPDGSWAATVGRGRRGRAVGRRPGHRSLVTSASPWTVTAATSWTPRSRPGASAW